jgi:hypothetical protein
MQRFISIRMPNLELGYMMKLSVLVLTMVLFSSASVAQKTPVIGAGNVSCGKWLEARNEMVVYQAYTQWVLGFISGSNWNAEGPKATPADGEAIVYFVDVYCKNNPLSPLAHAAAVAVQETGGPKVYFQWNR